MKKFATPNVLGDVAYILSSSEAKAIESANILAERLTLQVQIEEELHKNDRSATGILPPPEFEATADQFFAYPNESIRGWERAVDAQTRIVKAVDRVIAASPNGDVAIVAHGGVGTLLVRAHLRSPISRRFDQPNQGQDLVLHRNPRRAASMEVDLAHQGSSSPVVACQKRPEFSMLTSSMRAR
jgi:broad specificity phosphatase PhoE